MTIHRAVLIATIVLATAVASASAGGNRPIELAQACEVVLPDGRFPSMMDYVVGTWVWERRRPRQTVQMRFSRNGDFFFDNSTIGLIHHGRYEFKSNALHVKVHRSCERGRCTDRNSCSRWTTRFSPLVPTPSFPGTSTGNGSTAIDPERRARALGRPASGAAVRCIARGRCSGLGWAPRATPQGSPSAHRQTSAQRWRRPTNHSVDEKGDGKE
jgi:hypothetical protein